ncbi:MAG: UDP-3-O-(3-hydroxymyristoyl)glucosamine N-acyltransferase [Fimbriimonadaceae bacterium]
MEKQPSGWTLEELATLLGGELSGSGDVRIERPVPSDSPDPAGITFAEDKEHLELAEASGVAAIIVGRECESCSKPTIVVDDPRSAFFKLLALAAYPLPLGQGIHPTAIVSKNALIAPSASIGPYVVVEKGAVIGSNARVFPFCYVGERCKIDEGSTLYPHVVLYRDVQIGKLCVIHSGAVLGADGFGFVWTGKVRQKIPQVGSVTLGDEVEIGANTAVDRATAGATLIGDGTKIDNLVQVGHNVRIGDHCVIAGLAAMAGSSRLGDRVTMGGQAALSHHARVTDDVTLGGRTGVTQDIEEPGEYFGLPAKPLNEAIRSMSLVTKLPTLLARIRELEKQVAELKKKAK